MGAKPGVGGPPVKSEQLGEEPHGGEARSGRPARGPLPKVIRGAGSCLVARRWHRRQPPRAAKAQVCIQRPVGRPSPHRSGQQDKPAKEQGSCPTTAPQSLQPTWEPHLERLWSPPAPTWNTVVSRSVSVAGGPLWVKGRCQTPSKGVSVGATG